MMTLKELRMKMRCPETMSVPSAKVLREMGGVVLDQIDLGADSEMVAYENGFVYYRSGKRSTVISAFTSGGYVYELAEGDEKIDEGYFDDQDWYVRLMLEAEDRIEKNYYKRTHCVSFDAESEEWGKLASPIEVEGAFLRREALEELFDLLRDDQKRVLSLYYLQGETMESIGAALGISKQGVDYIRRRGIERCREKLGIDFLEVFSHE